MSNNQKGKKRSAQEMESDDRLRNVAFSITQCIDAEADLPDAAKFTMETFKDFNLFFCTMMNASRVYIYEHWSDCKSIMKPSDSLWTVAVQQKWCFVPSMLEVVKCRFRDALMEKQIGLPYNLMTNISVRDYCKARNKLFLRNPFFRHFFQTPKEMSEATVAFRQMINKQAGEDAGDLLNHLEPFLETATIQELFFFTLSFKRNFGGGCDIIPVPVKTLEPNVIHLEFTKIIKEDE